MCQLRLDFLDLSLAPPDGNGICNRDVITVTGGSSYVPPLCGINSGQHIYVNFDGSSPITINIVASSSFSFGRKWHIATTQFECDSAQLGGCRHGESMTRTVHYEFISSPIGMPSILLAIKWNHSKF